MRPADTRFIVSGMVVVGVAIGIGRFLYTPLLPIMERNDGLSVSLAGTLASVNLFGYLLGALLAMHPGALRRRLQMLRLSLAGIVVLTAAMAGVAWLWLPLRFLTGACSGLVFVFASSIALERSTRARAPAWTPLVYAGVGLGVALTGIAVPFLSAHGGSKLAWTALALAGAGALLLTARWFIDDAPPGEVPDAPRDVDVLRHPTPFGWLLAIYTAEGFVYVIPATFLVAIFAQTPGLAQYASLAWVCFGLANAVATFPWIAATARWGKARVLAVAFGIQTLGVAAPVFSSGPATAIFSAVALGSTYLAIPMFAMGLGRDIFPSATNATLSRLTVLYSIGQIVGPLVATRLILQYHSYQPALLAAAVVGALATIVTLRTIRERTRPLS